MKRNRYVENELTDEWSGVVKKKTQTHANEDSARNFVHVKR